MFKIVKGYEDVDRNIFFKLKEGNRTRGHKAALLVIIQLITIKINVMVPKGMSYDILFCKITLFISIVFREKITCNVL